MVGLHHGFNGNKFRQTLGDSDRQGSLAYCSPWVRKDRHNLVTEQQYIILNFILATLRKSFKIDEINLINVFQPKYPN